MLLAADVGLPSAAVQAASYSTTLPGGLRADPPAFFMNRQASPRSVAKRSATLLNENRSLNLPAGFRDAMDALGRRLASGL